MEITPEHRTAARPRFIPGAALLAVALAATLAAGCGGGEDTEPIRDVVIRYQQAFVDRDGEALCETLAPSAISELGGIERCANDVGRDLRSPSVATREGADRLTIASITIEDDLAVVAFDQPIPDAVVIREDGDWYMAPLTE